MLMDRDDVAKYPSLDFHSCKIKSYIDIVLRPTESTSFENLVKPFEVCNLDHSTQQAPRCK